MLKGSAELSHSILYLPSGMVDLRSLFALLSLIGVAGSVRSSDYRFFIAR